MDDGFAILLNLLLANERELEHLLGFFQKLQSSLILLVSQRAAPLHPLASLLSDGFLGCRGLLALEVVVPRLDPETPLVFAGPDE